MATKTAQKTPETPQEIESKLQELEKHKDQVTTVELVDVFSLIQEYELTDEIRELLGEKISRQKTDLLRTLRSIPRSIQKPIEWPTRIENAKKKVDLLISFVTAFIEKIEKLDSKEYKLYTVKKEYTPSQFAMTPRGNENIGGKFLWRKFDIQELESKRNDIVFQLQSIKSRLDILKRWVSIIDANNNNEEEQRAFDEIRQKIANQEQEFLQIYDSFPRLIIPSHIADTIATEELYKEADMKEEHDKETEEEDNKEENKEDEDKKEDKEENVKAQIQEYFNWKYSLDHKEWDNKEDDIPNWIDQDSLDFQEKIPLQKIKTEVKTYFGWFPHSLITALKLEPVSNPLTIEQIEYIPLQYPMDEYLSYLNPEYEKAQEIREKYEKQTQ